MTTKATRPIILTSLFLALPLVCAAVTPAATSQIDTTDPTVPEVNIGQDGTAIVKGMKVWQKAGTSLFTRTTWDKSFIRWTIKTTADTVVTKRYGDKMTVYDIVEGDYLSLEGYIEGGNSLALVATKITDWSNYQAQTSFSGKISSLGSGNRSFILSSDNYGNVTVNLGTTTTIVRNRREIIPKYLRIGDKILSISGNYDHQAKTLDAGKITVYLDSKILTPQNYQGTLLTLAGHTLPTTMTVKVNGTTYNVNLSSETTVLNVLKRPATLDRFLEGDTIRFYGFIKQDNDELDTINASVLRNISF